MTHAARRGTNEPVPPAIVIAAGLAAMLAISAYTLIVGDRMQDGPAAPPGHASDASGRQER